MVSHASEVKQVGLDVHKHFSRVTARAASGKVLFRQRLEHADRSTLRAEFASWPRGTPVVLEGTFGWGWMADDLAASGLEPHLTSGSKTHAWRMSHSQAKNNRLDADLLSELMSERTRWWEVWLAPASVRQLVLTARGGSLRRALDTALPSAYPPCMTGLSRRPSGEVP